MAARQVRCWKCDTPFYGRADARYCSNACRQKAHRERVARGAAEKHGTAPDLSDLVIQARATRRRARQTREAARTTRRAAAESLARMKRRDS
ncbi:hypothetical protein BOH72_12590 [Mycobacterium sp. WY10]|nr:hypothetical protein BOH72_12590 [Mycobacterium sp. WY10]